MLSLHLIYQKLGRDAERRQICYRELFSDEISDETMGVIRDSLQTGTPVGSEIFRAEVDKLLELKVGQARRARPRKVGANS